MVNNRYLEQKIFIEFFLSGYFEKLNKENINCILILGNDDLESLDNEFDKVCQKYSNIYNIDVRLATVEDCVFIGLSKVLDHPFGCKDRVVMENNLKMQMQLSSSIRYKNEEFDMFTWEKKRKTIETMESILDNLPKNEDKTKKTIYVFHNPPYGIGLDVCNNGDKVGSKATTNFFFENQPYMSLHGHIHESYRVTGKWKENIGKTICLQTGQTEKGSNQMYYAIVDTTENIQDLVLLKNI